MWDKYLVILAMTAIALFVLWHPPTKEAMPLLRDIVLSLGSIATGTALGYSLALRKEKKHGTN